MKAAFFVDHIFRQDAEGQIYTMGGKFPAIGWRSYLEHFAQLTVVSRVLPETGETKGRLALSSAPGVNFVGVSPRRGWKRLLDGPLNARIVHEQVEAADVIVVRLPSELGLTAAKIARKLGKPYLVEMVACPWDSLFYHGSLAARCYAPILALRTRLAARNAPIVRYVTKYFLQKRYPTNGKEFVASNVELNGEVPSNDDRAFSGEKPIVFGTIGSLNTKLKGIQTALDALTRLKEARPDLKFEYRVLGEGSTEQFKDASIAENVRFYGVLPSGKPVLDWLDGIDIYMQPSFQEGLPRAMIEALSRGCLCIASTAGGNPELLPPTRLHKPGNDKELFGCISSVVELPLKDRKSESSANEKLSEIYHSNRLLEIRKNSIKELALLALAKSK